MPIIDLQRRIAETGRIRIGQQIPHGKTSRPVKLETFRFTSGDQQKIGQLARLYGGQPQPWEAPAGHQWEVITEARAIPVIVPPAGMAFTQNYELWSAGGCKRRCDGVNEMISEGECLCQPDARVCDIHTRLSVLLAELPGLGVWRIDTQGYYAAVELAAAVEVITMAAGTGKMLPARLVLMQRSVKRINPDTGKPQTFKFAVPVLDIDITPAALLTPPPRPELGNGAAPAPDGALAGNLVPVPADETPLAVGTIAEQIAAADQPAPRPPRKRAAVPIPETGIVVRTAEQAAGDENEPWAAPEPPAGPDADANGWAPPDPPADRPDNAHMPGTITRAQMTKLHATLTGMGYESRKDRDHLLELTETLAGRRLTGPYTGADGSERTTKNLSFDDAHKVIDQLNYYRTQERLEEYARASDEPAPY